MPSKEHKPAKQAGEIYLRWQIWTIYLLLFAIAIPWYWRFIPINEQTLWLGVPPWFFTAMLGSLAISLFTAWQLRKSWPVEQQEAEKEAKR